MFEEMPPKVAEILDLIRSEGRADVTALSRRFGISESTGQARAHVA